MPEDLKSTFDLELNPFERSFATKESSVSNTPSEPKEGEKGVSNGLSIPTLSHLDLSNGKLPTITPTLFTPGGRRLPPLGLSPGGNLSHPETPGSNLWNSLLSATNNPSSTAHEGNDHSHGNPSFSQNSSNFHHFVNNIKKSGLTPNESNLRSGLTPGGINGSFQFVPQVLGLTTPGALMNSGMMSGFSNMNGIAAPSTSSGVGHDFPNPNRSAPKNVDNRSYKTAESNDTHEIDDKESEKRQSEPVEDSPKRRKTEAAQKSKKTNSAKKEPESTDNKKTTKRLSETDKRKNFLERNRVAASKCRQRKKQLVQKMEDELAFYSTGYRELSSQVAQLRDQLVNVRGILIGHKDCPMLSNLVGGYEQLHNMIQQINYVTQVTSRNQQNATSIPSTIPTTLNNPHDNTNVGFSNSNMNNMMPMPLNNMNALTSNSPHSGNSSGIKFASNTPETSVTNQQVQSQPDSIQPLHLQQRTLGQQNTASVQPQQSQQAQSQGQAAISQQAQATQITQTQQPQVASQMASQQHQPGIKQLPTHIDSQGLPIQSSLNQSTHHLSLTNLPAAAGNATSSSTMNTTNFPASTGAGDLRAINSMSNITGLNNTNENQQVLNGNSLTSYNLRPINSMIDLNSQQALQSQPSNFATDMNIISMGRQHT